MTELNEKHDELRHLKLDDVVKDEYLAQLRTDLVAVEEREAARLTDIDWLQGMRQGLEADVEGLRAEVERLRAELSQFRYRLADRANTALHRAPVAHRLTKSLFRIAVRARGRLRRGR